ncbi:hypothetical protein [Bacillus cereus group sp. MG21]|uniref:hypothetical protein n=1 Tax=Bacillus cereus group sp. MG21 TaxID=3040251 RepID=UPI003392AA13
MFQRISKLYRDLLKQNIKLNDENANLRITNMQLQNHITFLQEFNAELLKDNLEFQSKLLPQEAYKG